MRAYIILFILGLFGFAAKAQMRPVYFYGNEVTTDASKATSYGVYGKLSSENLWILKRYDLYDNLMQTGSYKDELLTTPHGTFTFYMDLDYFNMLNDEHFKLKNKRRFKYQEGSFVDGLEQGKWVLYYPDGNIFNEQNYKDGKLHGEFKTLDRYGKYIMKGNYVMGQKEGEWIIEKGTKRQIYENDVLKSTEKIKPQK